MAMDWKQNWLIGIGAVVVVIAGVAWLVAPPILTRSQDAKMQDTIRQSPDYQRWREHEDQAEHYYNTQTPKR